MATVSQTAQVVSGKEWQVGIGVQSTGWTALAASHAFQTMPLHEVTLPTIGVQEAGGIWAGTTGMIEKDIENFRTEAGGEHTWSFSMYGERTWLARLMAGVTFDHAQSTTKHTFEFKHDGLAARPAIGTGMASSPDAVTGPFVWTIAFKSPRSNEGLTMHNAVLRSLTVTFDPTSNEGRAYYEGEFVSYHAIAKEQNHSGSWELAPAGAPNYLMAGFKTHTLDVDDDDNNVITLHSASFEFNNNATRIGYDDDGNADGISIGVPQMDITGSITCKMDDTIAMNDGTNVLQDFVTAGASATLNLEIGDGTVDALGEMDIIANIMYTGQPEADLANDAGVMWNLPFKVVQPTASGAANGIAFQMILEDGVASSVWT